MMNAADIAYTPLEKKKRRYYTCLDRHDDGTLTLLPATPDDVRALGYERIPIWYDPQTALGDVAEMQRQHPEARLEVQRLQADGHSWTLVPLTEDERELVTFDEWSSEPWRGYVAVCVVDDRLVCSSKFMVTSTRHGAI